MPHAEQPACRLISHGEVSKSPRSAYRSSLSVFEGAQKSPVLRRIPQPPENAAQPRGATCPGRPMVRSVLRWLVAAELRERQVEEEQS